MDLQSIMRVDVLDNARDLNEHFKSGWVLLAISTGQRETSREIAVPELMYCVGLVDPEYRSSGNLNARITEIKQVTQTDTATDMLRQGWVLLGTADGRDEEGAPSTRYSLGFPGREAEEQI